MKIFAVSPGCTSILMLAKALGVELNKKVVNRRLQEHMTPEFLKINPQHSVPTFVDGKFILVESRAILTYLVEKHGKDDSLYPKDPQARAYVNQRLYFDMGTLYQSFADFYYPQLFEKAPADPAKLKKISDALEFLDGFLSASKFVAGDIATIADFCTMTSISAFDNFGYDFSRFKNLTRWYELCKVSLPGSEEIQKMNAEMKKISEMLKA